MDNQILERQDLCCYRLWKWGRFAFSTGSSSETVGVDISSGQICRAKEKCAKLHKIHLVVADAENLPFRGESFDSMFCKSILHHLPHLPRALIEARRVIKHDGLFFIAAEPGLLNLIAAIGRKFFPSNVHTPGEKAFIFSHLTKLIKGLGFVEIQTKYFHLITHGLALKVLTPKWAKVIFAKIIFKVLLGEFVLSKSRLKTFYWLFSGVFKKKTTEEG